VAARAQQPAVPVILRDSRDRIVRHGQGPHRAIQTGVGPIEVRRAEVRDRGGEGAEKIPEAGAADEESRYAVAGFFTCMV
jgi:hypothetical protein